MGTHPIFESDFDCLTDCRQIAFFGSKMSEKEPRTPLKSPAAPYRDYGFPMPASLLSRDNIFATSSTNTVGTVPDDLSLLAGTLERLDAELERDIAAHLTKKPSSSDVPSNLDLLQGAMKRISMLEQQVKDANKRTALAEANARLSSKAGSMLSGRELEHENEQLRRQIHEMESFLADYGLIWVGGDDDENDEDEDDGIDSIDWAKIIANLKELNDLAEADDDKVVASTVRSKFGQLTRRQKTPHITIVLYQDGILLGRGPFRPLDQCDLLIQDLIDGFFPSELQTRYPDGVLFDVEDAHERPFGRMFPGVGKRINSEPSSLPVVDYRDPSVIRTADLLDLMPPPAEIRSSFGSRPVSSSSSRAKSTGPLATLRVKTLQGTNHIVKLRFDDTLARLREYLTPIVETADFNIMAIRDANQGWQVVSDETATLAELRLTPRAALQLSRRTTTKAQLISASIGDLAQI